MKTLRLLGRDTTNGILRRSFLFIIPLLFAVSQTRELHSYLNDLVDRNALFTNGTLADYILFVTKGMSVYYFDPKEYFQIPIYWFAFQIGLAYLLAYYASDDFHSNGMVLFIAVGSRSKWWISKFIYCIVTVVLYYAVCIGGICVTAALYGADMRWGVTPGLAVRLYTTSTVSMGTWDVLCVTILLPVLVSVAVCQVQMLAGFLITPVVSFAGVCAMYVLSAYYTVWYLPGNYTMWQRASYIEADGVNPASGLVLSAGMILISLIGGLMYFDRKDIL